MLSLFTNQKKLVRKIHNEFDTAEARLLQEAKRIIEFNHQVSDIGERLVKVGFVSSRKAVEFNANSKALAERREQANLIQYYQQKYPCHKFITEAELIRICNKYNLIYAPIDRYNEDVPEKNLADIENATELYQGDYPHNEVFTLLKYHYVFDILGMSWFTAKRLGLPREIKNERFSFWSNADDYLRRKYGITRQYIVKRSTVVEINKQGLFIAAPKSHFDLKGLHVDGLLHTSFSIIQPKDPIVFRFVQGGVQIITKWGLEASDRSLTNETMN